MLLKWKQNHNDIWFYSHKIKEKQFDLKEYGGHMKQIFLQISHSTAILENNY